MKYLVLLGFLQCLPHSFGQILLQPTKPQATTLPKMCRSRGSALGECKKIEDCPQLAKLYNNGNITTSNRAYLRQFLCDVRVSSRNLIVCCIPQETVPEQAWPQSTSTVPTTTSLPTFLSFTSKVTRGPEQIVSTHYNSENLLPIIGICGNGTIIGQRIIGGEETSIDQYPWTALIEYTKQYNRKGHHCGGSLINARYVLTAAHCIVGRDIPKTWTATGVRLGEWDKDSMTDCDVHNSGICFDPYKDIAIEEIKVHDGFSKQANNNLNDIALLRLAEEVRYSPTVRPICLPLSESLAVSNYVGKNVVISGWGRTLEKGSSSKKLAAEIKVVDWELCKVKYETQDIVLEDKHLCAGGVDGVDSCTGDSGGALILESNSIFYTVGIISFGPNPCAQEGWAGVYTRVDKYIDWIKTNIRA